jgi:hypothetical protein
VNAPQERRSRLKGKRVNVCLRSILQINRLMNQAVAFRKHPRALLFGLGALFPELCIFPAELSNFVCNLLLRY